MYYTISSSLPRCNPLLFLLLFVPFNVSALPLIIEAPDETLRTPSRFLQYVFCIQFAPGGVEVAEVAVDLDFIAFPLGRYADAREGPVEACTIYRLGDGGDFEQCNGLGTSPVCIYEVDRDLFE